MPPKKTTKKIKEVEAETDPDIEIISEDEEEVEEDDNVKDDTLQEIDYNKNEIDDDEDEDESDDSYSDEEDEEDLKVPLDITMASGTEVGKSFNQELPHIGFRETTKILTRMEDVLATFTEKKYPNWELLIKRPTPSGNFEVVPLKELRNPRYVWENATYKTLQAKPSIA